MNRALGPHPDCIPVFKAITATLALSLLLWGLLGLGIWIGVTA